MPPSLPNFLQSVVLDAKQGMYKVPKTVKIIIWVLHLDLHLLRPGKNPVGRRKSAKETVIRAGREIQTDLSVDFRPALGGLSDENIGGSHDPSGVEGGKRNAEQVENLLSV